MRINRARGCQWLCLTTQRQHITIPSAPGVPSDNMRYALKRVHLSVKSHFGRHLSQGRSNITNGTPALVSASDPRRPFSHPTVSQASAGSPKRMSHRSNLRQVFRVVSLYYTYTKFFIARGYRGSVPIGSQSRMCQRYFHIKH